LPRIEPLPEAAGGAALRVSKDSARSARRARHNSTRLVKKISVMIVADVTHQMQIA
jgi:hypothetical protein